MIVNAAVKEGYLKAVVTPEAADAFLIAVPTPFLPCKEGEVPAPDLSYIEAASKAIAPVLKKGDLVILESTSPVGTTEQMADWLAQARTDLTFLKLMAKTLTLTLHIVRSVCCLVMSSENWLKMTE